MATRKDRRTPTRTTEWSGARWFLFRLFGFQQGVMVVSRSQLGRPA